MKYTAHVPTEQFGYIGFEVEGEAADAVSAYRNLVNAYRSGAGIPDKQFNGFLDEYLTKGSSEGLAGVWEDMLPAQQEVFKAIKRSKGRTNK